MIYLYSLIGALYIILESYSWWSFILKPIPILMLAFLLFRIREKKGSRFIGIGLLFSAAGDVTLAIGREHYFILGLIFFLITHVCYIIAFIMYWRGKPTAKQIFLSLAIFVYGGGMISFLWTGLASLKFPVIIYVIVIATMAVAAFIRTPYNHMIFWGALFFMISDSLLAINRFAYSLGTYDFLVLVTYYSAQYLIAIGFYNEGNNEETS